MTKHILTATLRKTLGRKVKSLRAQGLIPANIFGKTIKSVSIEVPAKEFTKVYHEVGESTLIYLQVEDEKEDRPVLVREVTRHPVTGLSLHVDFNQVNLKEKVTAPVPVELTGEAPAETEKLGILVQQTDEIELEALPTDMPEKIEVSVENLVAVDDSIKASDLVLDASKVTLVSDPETIIAKIEALAKEEVVAPAPEVTIEGQPSESGAEETTETVAAEEKTAE